MEWTSGNFLHAYKGRLSDPNVSGEGDRSLNCLQYRKDNILQFFGISSLFHKATTTRRMTSLCVIIRFVNLLTSVVNLEMQP